MKVRINNVWYNCVSPSILTQNFNETLDSANIRISHLTEMLDIEPFDKVRLLMNAQEVSYIDTYMLVDSYECIQEGLDEVYYTYEISLFSCVKQLENILLPNIAITPNSENRSIYYYLSQYLNEYGDGTLSFDSSVETKFGVISCPEMQWNTPTLREVFNDLMMVADCICTIENTTIKFLDLTERGSEIENYNYIRRSRSSQDYVSEIRMNLQNAMEESGKIVTETIPFTSDSSIITSNNFVLKTQFPIKNIRHLYMNFCLYADTENRKWIYVRGDLMNILTKPLVVEFQEYETKGVIYKGFLESLTPGLDAYLYQNFCVYYNRYDNVIRGFNEVQKTGLFNTRDMNKVQLLGYIIALKLGIESNYKANDSTASYTSTFFDIEYETIHESVFGASKDGKIKNNRTIMDNQTNSFVNTKIQANLEYQKANRLGNEQLVINQRVENFNEAIKLKQTYNDSVIYQVQYQITALYNPDTNFLTQSHIEVNAIATKNYVLKNYFTGIKSHIRTWVNAKDEAITRHELIKERYTFSYNSNENDYSIFMTPLKFTEIKNVNFCLCKTKSNGNYILGGSALGFNMETINRILGKSIVLTISFKDNTIFKREINYDVINYADFDRDANQSSTLAKLKSSFLDDYGGVPTKNYYYVDNNFEFDSLELQFYFNEENFNYILDPTQFNVDDGSNFGDQYGIAGILKNIYEKAVIEQTISINNNILLSRTVNRHKDNKEIFKLSYQFEFGSSDIENIYVGNNFLERQQIINETQLNNNYRVFIANELSQILPNDKVEKTATITVDNNSIKCVVDATANDFVYICDSDLNIIVAFKYIQDTIYLNKES